MVLGVAREDERPEERVAVLDEVLVGRERLAVALLRVAVDAPPGVVAVADGREEDVLGRREGRGVGVEGELLRAVALGRRTRRRRRRAARRAPPAGARRPRPSSAVEVRVVRETDLSRQPWPGAYKEPRAPTPQARPPRACCVRRRPGGGDAASRRATPSGVSLATTASTRRATSAARAAPTSVGRPPARARPGGAMRFRAKRSKK